MYCHPVESQKGEEARVLLMHPEPELFQLLVQVQNLSPAIQRVFE